MKLSLVRAGRILMMLNEHGNGYIVHIRLGGHPITASLFERGIRSHIPEEEIRKDNAADLQCLHVTYDSLQS